MEQFQLYVIQNWSTIIEYTMMVVSYFLVFLYNLKVKGTRRDLTVLFKDEARVVRSTDAKLREDMARELCEAKAQYEAAVNRITNVERDLRRAENALRELILDTANTEDTEAQNDRDTIDS